MNKKVKSTASVALLSALTLATLSTVQPKPAQAVVGLAVGSLTTIIVGSSIAGLGALSWAAAIPWHRGDCSGYSGIGCLFFGAVGTILGIPGIIVLDGSGSASFGDLTDEQGDRAGLTDGERKAYANELPEINAVFQSNQAERMAEYQATGKVSVENSKADWTNESRSLSPEAFSAIQKIAAQATRRKD